MSRKHLATVTALVATAALAFAATATSSGTAMQARALATGPASAAQIGNVNVTLKIGKFVKRGGSLVAVGTAVAQFQPTVANPNNLQPATVTKQFTARVTTLKRFASTQRICPVLDLTLGPLDLNLLGLIVHLDTVHLTIRANSRGGVLGSLFCSLSHAKITLAKKAQRLTKAARMSGLNTKGVRLGVPLFVKSSGSASWLDTSAGKSPMTICPVLDLALGPLDLNLLGLLVHLDRVHLVITADSTGGVLGSLLCSLAGGTGSSGSPGS